MPNIQHLCLGNTSLTGTIPPAWTHLFGTLTSLDVSGAGLTGSLPDLPPGKRRVLSLWLINILPTWQIPSITLAATSTAFAREAASLNPMLGFGCEMPTGLLMAPMSLAGLGTDWQEWQMRGASLLSSLSWSIRDLRQFQYADLPRSLLESLDMSSNHFDSFLPPSWATRLSSLRSLDVSCNALEGEIPSGVLKLIQVHAAAMRLAYPGNIQVTV